MKKISDKDKKDWENFLNSKKKLFNKDDQEIKKKFQHKTKVIDLHGFTLESANSEIERFINLCFDNGVSKILIITGKGGRSKNKEDPYQSKDLSILKYSVPNFIRENNNLMKKILKIDSNAIETASRGDFEIILKKKNV